ncbi:MAG: hypothetical protein ABJN26_09645 [Stappiaceae bacterium]
MKKASFFPTLLVILVLVPAGALFAYGPETLGTFVPSVQNLISSDTRSKPARSSSANVSPSLSQVVGTEENSEEEHTGTVGMLPDAYCRKVTRPRAQSHKASLAACVQSEEEAQFELTAMCGTEELMDMWRQCASSNMSSVSQRSCMYSKLELTGSKHKSLLEAGLQLVAVAEYRNSRGLNISTGPGIALNEFRNSVIVVTGGDRIAYVGASKTDLSNDLVRWRRTINTGLRGGRFISPEFNLEAWRDTIYENGSLNIYAKSADNPSDPQPLAAQIAALKEEFAPAISTFSE